MLSFDTFHKNTWAASFLFWQVSALIFILHRYFTNFFDHAQLNWPAYVASLEALHVSLALITVPAFRRLSCRPPESFGSWLLYSITMAIAISVLTTIIFALLIILTPSHLNFSPDERSMRIQRTLLSSPLITWVISVVVLVAFSAWRFFKQHQSQLQVESKLREELAHARIQMLKNAAQTVAFDAVKATRNGKGYAGEPALKEIVRASIPAQRKCLFGIPLTKREKEILKLIAEEYTDHEIADKLSLSLLTVQTHRSNLTKKLEAKHTASPVERPTKHGLIC